MAFTTIDFANLLSDLEDEVTPVEAPEIQPPSMRDVDLGKPWEMDQPMQDACPNCGGWCMKLGDYVCWGICYRCFDAVSGGSE